MKKTFLTAAILVAASALSTQATAATTTIDLQSFSGTLIDNKWQDFSAFGLGIIQTSAPYTTNTSDGLGSVTLSPVMSLNDPSHIHVGGGDGNSATPTIPFIHGDVGGVFIDGAGSLDVFSFQSMDVLTAVLQSDSLTHPNATVTVRGYLGGVNGMMNGTVEADGITMQYNGGAQVAQATITETTLGTFDFLAADAGFGEVDYVEFFFSDFYRVTPSSLGDTALQFDFDNIVVGTVSAVPVPAAVWLFGTGLIGLVSCSKRKQNTLAA